MLYNIYNIYFFILAYFNFYHDTSFSLHQMILNLQSKGVIADSKLWYYLLICYTLHSRRMRHIYHCSRDLAE